MAAKRKRNYRKEYDDYHGTPEQIKRRASRNGARAKLKKAGVKVKGKDVDHKDGNPLNNSRKNLKVDSPKNQRKQGGRKTSGNTKGKRK